MRVVTLTTVLAVVLSVDAKNSAGTRENVCLNREDGTFIADNDSCSSFIVCYSGKAVSQNCEPGSYFDTKLLFCKPDTKNICSASECKENGAYSAHPTNCSLFNICDGGKFVEQSCGRGSYFDSANLFCRPDVDHICWPLPEICTCVGNYNEGEFVKDPDSCHSFYLCSKGELVHQTCGYGNYFDGSTSRCARDINAQCWPQNNPSCPEGVGEGDRVSNSKNCSGYLECIQGELVERNCPNEYLFDDSTKQCIPDIDGKCKCYCPDGSKQGDFVQNSANNCSSYFHCDKGELIPNDCGVGNYFDSRTNNCVRDTDGICWKTEKPCTCEDGRYQEGESVANEDNCSSYYICLHGILVPQSCGTGNYFDKNKKVCDRIPTAKNCSMYYECTKGDLVQKNCKYGFYFDVSTKQCKRDEDGKCWEICECHDGSKQGDLVGNSANCSLYFMCDGGKLIPGDCGFGNYFDNSTKNCVRDTNGICWKTEEPCTCEDGRYQEGESVGNPADCNTYYICLNGDLVPHSCGTGNYFDKNKKVCDRIPTAKNCSMYYECTKGDLVQKNCKYGFYFDVSTKQCKRDEDGKCWEICECHDGSKQGDLVGNSANCSLYFMCDGGKLIPGDCGFGNYFDNSTKNCVRDTNGICWKTEKPSTCEDGRYQEGESVGNPADCNTYYICLNGDLVPHSCGTGNYFDKNKKVCDRIPTAQNCSMYYECTKGDLVQKNCKYGFYFDVSTKQCKRDEDGKCWKICECHDGSKQGDLVGNSANCSLYFMCDGGKLIPGDCGFGNYFDNSTKNCVRDTNGICWKTEKPSTCEDGRYQEGESVGNPADCNTYYICLNGDLVPHSCGTGNYFDKNKKVCDRIPTAKNCSMYYECTKGDLVQKNCKYGFYFDVSTKQCKRDEDGKCWQICECHDGSKQGDLVGNSANCSLYFMCDGGKLIPGDCGFGNYFDNSTKNCVRDTNGICWKTEKPSTCEDGRYQEGESVGNPADCNTYYICLNGDLVPHSCGTGNYFDKNKKVCDRIPTAQNCSMYYECTKGDLVQKNCKYGFYFDVSTKQCKRDKDGKCWEICNCSDGSKQGDLIGNSANCSLYSICYGGKLIPGDCGFGNYFDNSTKNCVRDTNGICWKTEKPSTCEDGRYQEGESVGNPADCYTYYICLNGDLVPQNCGTGNYFDKNKKVCDRIPTAQNCSMYYECTKGDLVQKNCKYGFYFDVSTKQCKRDEDGKCWQICDCPDGSKQGDLIENIANCSLYSMCYGGKLIPGDCGFGNYFDNSTKNCVRDTNGICWKTEKPSTCEDGRYQEGESVGNPADCYTYYICLNGDLVPQNCGTGNYFDKKKKVCDRIPTAQNCSMYYECSKGDLVQKNCKYGFYFDVSTKQCKRDEDGKCWQICDCPDGSKQGDLIENIANCSLYSMCYGGKLIPGDCGFGNYFDNSTKNCVRDTNGICWKTEKPSTCEDGRYQEGESVGNPADCYTYYICLNGDLVPQNCGTGNYFDKKKKVCDRIPTAQNCSMYYECSKGDLVQKNCKYGFYFDVSTKQCKRDEDGKCWQICDCPDGSKQGDLIENIANCSLYSMCYGGKLIPGDCGFGNYFDNSTKNCVRDTNGICWKTEKPSTCEDGRYQEDETVGNENNCYSYYICLNGDLVPQNCGTGNYFDKKKKVCDRIPTAQNCSMYYECSKGDLVQKNCKYGFYFDVSTKQCKRDEDGKCWQICDCPDGSKQGDLIENIANCSLYSMCYGGKLIPGDCGFGNYFDNSTKNCVRDTNGICWKTEKPSTCEDGRYQEGESVGNPADCYTYYICLNGDMVPQNCGTGNYFDKKKKVCDRIPTAQNCSMYYECSKGDLVQKNCKYGFYFDVSTKQCKRDEDGKCWQICDCPDGSKQGDLIENIANCSLYSMCYGGKLIPGDCGFGNYFDNSTKNCVRDTNGICWKTEKPSTCEDGRYQEGESVGNPADCYTYYICLNGDLVPQNCGTGNYFDKKKKVCDRIPTVQNCSMYYECSKGDLVQKNCKYGFYFDVSTKQCKRDEDGKCWQICDCPDGSKQGDLIENIANCSLYSMCYGGKLIPGDCGFGNYFDNSTKNCVRDTNGICWKTEKPSTCEDGRYQEGESVGNPADCYTYYICLNGDLVPQNCGTGNYFDKKKKVCDRIPTAQNCSMYYECSKGDLVQKNCKYGFYFDVSTKQCKRDEDGKCWQICDCPDGSKQGDLIENIANCSLYSMCYGGKLIPGDCGFGNYFDNSTKNCVRDTNGICWKTEKPSTCEDGRYQEGESVGNPADCYTYYICMNGDLVPQNCGTGNYFDKKKKVCDRIPTAQNCSMYYECTKGDLVQKNCKYGFYFDVSTKQCKRDEDGKCWQICDCPDGSKQGDLIENIANCSLYSMCYGGKLIPGDCGFGNYFDNSTKNCVRDTNGICWKTEKPSTCEDGRYQEGESVGNPADCYTYYICLNGDLVPQNCGTGNYFDKKKKVCDRIPTAQNCSMYYECSKGDLVQKNCKYGFYFDVSTKQCKRDEDGKCWQICDCPDGSKQGDLIENIANCSLYSMCYGGKLIPGDCGFGNYFDNSTKNCVRDTNGICWKTEKPSTCEDGRYQEGESVGNPADCYTYYICMNGDLVPQNCGTGNYFDKKKKVCDRIPTAQNCSMYYECSKGDLVQKNCKYGFYFDVSTKQCKRDEDGKCWQICDCPDGSKQGDLIENIANCSLYSMCYGGKLIPGDCGFGNYFDNSTKNCVRDTNGICWKTEKPSTCEDGRYQEGESVGNPADCYTYYICMNGDLVPQNCGTGNYFDKKKKVCDRIPTAQNCSMYYECSKGDLVQKNCKYGFYFDVSTKQCKRDEDGKCWQICDCPDGSKQGDLIENIANCSLYSMCYGGKLIPGDCGFGNYFDNSTKKCIRDINGLCWKNPESCKCPSGLEEGQLTSVPGSCHKYSVCHNGVDQEFSCGTGNLFNNVTNVCQPDFTGECWCKPETPCVCSYGLKDGDRTDNPESCHMYFICSKGNLIEGNCGTGNYFNNDTKTCERDTNNCCWPCANGEMIANIEECDKFSICNDGKFVEQQCGTGYYFDAYAKYCMRDVNGTCWKAPPPSNTCQGAKDGTLLPNSAACEKYFECQNNKAVSRECGMGNLFNSTTLSCVHDTCGECWTKIPNVCANKPTGTFLPSAEHCDQFVVCHENHAIVQQCGNGNWFNPKSLLCEQDLYAKCINVCQNTEGITQLPHPNCNEFYLCENGLTKAVRTCLKGTNYDAIRGICLASATCEENLCSTSPNGVSYPVRNDPSSFYTCYNKKPVKLMCPSGTSFDSERLICIPDTGLCIGKKNGFTLASKKNANAYYVCKDNAAIFEQCPAHTVFDENKGICVHALRKRVVNNICSTEADGTMMSGNVCNKFHICLDGESIEQNCGAYKSFNPKTGSCVFNATCFNPKEICGKSSDIEKFPDARHQASYVACKRGVATLEKCPKNTIYSHDIGSCVPSIMAIQNKDLSEMCRQVPDKTITPALDCRKFYICSNQIATLQQCAIDQVFNMTTGNCQADTERKCWMRSETLRKSSFLRMVDDNDDYKIVCQECHKRYEPKIHIENKVSKIGMTLLRNPRSIECSSKFESLFRQSEKSCTEFYYCEEDQWKLKKCPLGKFFNTQLETCTTDRSFCEIQSTDIYSCLSNATKLNAMNCGSYYICFEGTWHHRHCQEGTYFNQTHGNCVKVNGSCQSMSKHEHACKNGTIVKMNLISCSAYTICIDERWLIKHCPDGHYFNETFTACMQDNDGQCANDSQEKYAVRKFKPTNCTVFEISINNDWLTVDCPTGLYFDIFLNKCLVNNGECSSNGLIFQNCVNQTLQPSFSNFSEFYQCLNNEWHLESCMANLEFDTIVKKCKASNTYTNSRDLMNLPKCNKDNPQSGFYYSHETDCTKFYFCEDGIRFEGVCNKGRFFDMNNQQCQNDRAVCDDTKQMTYDTICRKSSNGTILRNPSNCSTFYTCINMTAALLTNCSQGNYFDAELGGCQSDISKCIEKRHCDVNNPIKFPHETYCSIYYTCIGGKLIAIACEELYFFDPVLNECVPDKEKLCVDGLLKNSSSIVNVTAVTSIITDSISCIGKHGDIMPDPKNCNKFYVCINEQLRHDKCFEGEFFDITKNSCITKISIKQCPNITDITIKCSNNDREVNYADHTDCRKYYQCNDVEVVSKKCRNGESFDNLLGFCRQNDGTCLIENGQRVGACAGKHGKLVEDADNCQQYFACINGQKISKKCKAGEYFDKSASMCEKDLNKTCTTFEDELINKTQLSCEGLNESIFYPNALDGCKSFFECVNSIPKIHNCPEDFLYDNDIEACNWKEKVKCLNEFHYEQKNKL